MSVVGSQACVTGIVDGVPHASAPSQALEVPGHRLDLQRMPPLCGLASDPRELLGDHAGLDVALPRETYVLPVATTAASGIGAGWQDAVRRRHDDGDRARPDESAMIRHMGDLDADLLSGDPATDKDDESVVPSDGLTTVCHRRDRQVEVCALSDHLVNHRSIGSRPAARPRRS